MSNYVPIVIALATDNCAESKGDTAQKHNEGLYIIVPYLQSDLLFVHLEVLPVLDQNTVQDLWFQQGQLTQVFSCEVCAPPILSHL